MIKKKSGFAPGARPICAFCNAQWTDDMVRVLDFYAAALENVATVDITCTSCQRRIYRKGIPVG